MTDGKTARSGGRVLVDALVVNGAELVFCVPGESYVTALDAFYDAPQVRVVACRHEAGAGNMAEAYGKLSGRPGICFVTRGPGATHASIAVHTARQDSTPLILFVGQVARGNAEREAFQEIDLPRMFGPITKWAAQIDDARRIPEYVARAFHVATSGRAGPVVLALPEDMLRDEVAVADLRATPPSLPHPGAGEIARFREIVESAQRPLMILGGSGWDAQACAAIRRFAERSGIPTTCSFRRQALFDNRHPLYAGDVGIGINPALAARIGEADLLIAVGGRLGEMPNGNYTLVAAPRPRQRLVHVHADPDELGRVFAADLAINAAPAHFAAAVADLAVTGRERWAGWARDARADYEESLRPPSGGEGVDLAAIVAHLSARLPDDAIVANGAGNFTTWVHRFYQYREPGTQLAPTSGAMGYGVPAAIAAKLYRPQRTVVAFAGDGDFLMTGQELATAVQYGAAVVFLVVNNGMYGTIRMHQERHHPGRVIATDLVNPDFAAYARAFGAHGVVVERTADFANAFEEAVRCGRPALIELRVNADVITPRTTLQAIRRTAEAARAGSGE